MKRILITGKNSYIGNSFENWVKKLKDKYEVVQIDVRDGKWREESFCNYDVILHVAGIAHVSANPKLKDLYYEVNRDLAIDVANKAKNDGVKQFIFMSSMIIYGKDAPIDEKKVIDLETNPECSDFYGKSKLEADLAIQKLKDEKFRPVIVRTPMVYGPNCKGNFNKLKKIAKISAIFPNIDNMRSMIYIDNLCEFFKQTIDNDEQGVFYPQNREYVSTKEIIEIMAKMINKKVFFIRIFNPIIRLFSRKISFINRIFGNKTYSKEISGDFSYCIVEFEESIRRS